MLLNEVSVVLHEPDGLDNFLFLGAHIACGNRIQAVGGIDPEALELPLPFSSVKVQIT